MKAENGFRGAGKALARDRQPDAIERRASSAILGKMKRNRRAFRKYK